MGLVQPEHRVEFAGAAAQQRDHRVRELTAPFDAQSPYQGGREERRAHVRTTGLFLRAALDEPPQGPDPVDVQPRRERKDQDVDGVGASELVAERDEGSAFGGFSEPGHRISLPLIAGRCDIHAFDEPRSPLGAHVLRCPPAERSAPSAGDSRAGALARRSAVARTSAHGEALRTAGIQTRGRRDRDGIKRAAVAGHRADVIGAPARLAPDPAEAVRIAGTRLILRAAGALRARDAGIVARCRGAAAEESGRGRNVSR
jgi:hypothetical protein